MRWFAHPTARFLHCELQLWSVSSQIITASGNSAVRACGSWVKLDVRRFAIYGFNTVNAQAIERRNITKTQLLNNQFRVLRVIFKLEPLFGPTRNSIQNLALGAAALSIGDSLCFQLIYLLQFGLQPIKICARDGAAIIIAVY